MATAIIKIGERLAEARDLFRYDRSEGGFAGWCEKRLSFSHETARRMISVYEAFGESSKKSWNFEALSKEALFTLAAPSTPEEVRIEVEQMLIDGQKVTAADVKRMKAELQAARDLVAAKKSLGYGRFLAWIAAEFEMSEQTARKMMRVAEMYDGKSNLSFDLPPTVLYALAAPSTPDEVREKVEKDVAEGTWRRGITGSLGCEPLRWLMPVHIAALGGGPMEPCHEFRLERLLGLIEGLGVSAHGAKLRRNVRPGHGPEPDRDPASDRLAHDPARDQVGDYNGVVVLGGAAKA